MGGDAQNQIVRTEAANGMPTGARAIRCAEKWGTLK